MGTLRWILLILGIAVIAFIYFRGRRKTDPVWPRREPRLDAHEPAPRAALTEPSASTDQDVPAPARSHSSHDTASEPEPEPEAEREAEREAEALDFDNLIIRGLEKEVHESGNRRPEPETPPDRSTTAAEPSRARENDKAPTMLLDEELVVLHVLSSRGGEFSGRELYFALQRSGFEKRRGDVFYCYGDEGEYMAVNAIKPGTFPEDPEELSTRAIGLILRLSACEKPLSAFDEFLALAQNIRSMVDGRLCDSRRSSLTPQTIGYLRDEVQQYHIKHLKARRSR